MAKPESVDRADMERIAERAAVQASEFTASKLIKEFSKEGNPGSEKCERVLASPVKCWDFRGTRRYAACVAWATMEERHIPWAEAIREGWRKAREVCQWNSTD